MGKGYEIGFSGVANFVGEMKFLLNRAFNVEKEIGMLGGGKCGVKMP